MQRDAPENINYEILAQQRTPFHGYGRHLLPSRLGCQALNHYTGSPENLGAGNRH